MKKLKFSQLMFMIGCAFMFTAATADAQELGRESIPGAVMEWIQDSIVATVVDVMPDSGLITLESDGVERTLQVDQSIDLNNLTQGDSVSVNLFMAQALSIEEPTDEDRQNPFVVMEMVQPPQGTIPAAGGARQIRALVTITDLNEEEMTATIRGPEKRSYVVRVQDQANFDMLERDQEYVVVFNEGVAASVNKL